MQNRRNRVYDRLNRRNGVWLKPQKCLTAGNFNRNSKTTKLSLYILLSFSLNRKNRSNRKPLSATKLRLTAEIWSKPQPRNVNSTPKPQLRKNFRNHKTWSKLIENTKPLVQLWSSNTLEHRSTPKMHQETLVSPNQRIKNRNQTNLTKHTKIHRSKS